MARRQKILISLMVLAVLYGLYEFFYAGGEDKPKSSTPAVMQVDELNKLAAEVEALLLKGTDVQDAYIVTRAETEWLVDPFYAARAVAAEQLRLFFTGYLEMGKRKVAIINGIDYEVGDYLAERPDFQVRSIRPNEVVITDRRGIANIPIPFVE